MKTQAPRGTSDGKNIGELEETGMSLVMDVFENFVNEDKSENSTESETWFCLLYEWITSSISRDGKNDSGYQEFKNLKAERKHHTLSKQ